MQIQIEEQSALLGPQGQTPLHSPNALMTLHIRLVIVSIQVETDAVGAVVATCHAVWVQHRYQLELELLSQAGGPGVL